MLWRNAKYFAKTLVRGDLTRLSQKVALRSTAVTPSHRQLSTDQLPRLPVPPLKQTTDRFLDTIRPLVTDDEYSNAQQLVSDFLQPQNVSHKLQSLLEQRAEARDNWLSDWWLDIAYLEFRVPVMINVSPGILLPKQNFKGVEGQIRTAAKAISGVLDYKSKLSDGSLPVDKLGGSPLCMRQYHYMLSTCRVPGDRRDSVVNFPLDESRHVTVIRNNHLFSVPVYGSDGRPLSTNQLAAQLQRVVEQSATKAPPVGILTSDSRDNWARAYQALSKDKRNSQNLADVQRSIVVLCLDEPLPNDNPFDEKTAYLRQANNGGGSGSNTGNRWFDKTLQIIVGPDGFVGGTYEHATAEGPPILSILDHLTLNYITKDVPSEDAASDPKPPTRLDFNLNAETQGLLQMSSQAADSVITDLDMAAFQFDGYGKNFIKSQKLSPDAFIQVAFQLAYYKLYGHSTATYESGSLRKFALGRTETIRSCTAASHAYCQAVQDPNGTPRDRAARLREAVQAHREYTDAVVAGRGIDRHFLGLKLTALENSLDLPRLFLDPVFESSCTWRISTSQVASKSGGVLGFGPVVPDGYGICYNPMKDGIFFALSAWNSCPTTSTAQLRKSLHEALMDAHDILLQAQEPRL